MRQTKQIKRAEQLFFAGRDERSTTLSGVSSTCIAGVGEQVDYEKEGQSQIV